MDSEDHGEALEKWLGEAPQPNFPLGQDLSEALYAFSERGFFDGLTIHRELAIQLWSVVEAVRTQGFPKTLRM